MSFATRICSHPSIRRTDDPPRFLRDRLLPHRQRAAFAAQRMILLVCLCAALATLSACGTSGSADRRQPGASTTSLVGPDGSLRVSVGVRTPNGSFAQILPAGCVAPCVQSASVIPPENGASGFELMVVTANPGPPIVEERAERYAIGRIGARPGVAERVVIFMSVRDGALALRAFDRTTRAELPVRRVAP